MKRFEKAMSAIVVFAAMSIGVPLDVVSLWMTTMSFFENIQKKGHAMSIIDTGWDGVRGTASHLLRIARNDDGRAPV